MEGGEGDFQDFFEIFNLFRSSTRSYEILSNFLSLMPAITLRDAGAKVGQGDRGGKSRALHTDDKGSEPKILWLPRRNSCGHTLKICLKYYQESSN